MSYEGLHSLIKDSAIQAAVRRLEERLVEAEKQIAQMKGKA